MEITIRNSDDPLTKTLAFLFKAETSAQKLKLKMRSEMIPLVTQVAIKIGAIHSEKSVRDRALPVFTGVISIYLASITDGKNCEVLEEWVKTLNDNNLNTLFRKGYTMLHEVVTNVHFGKDGMTGGLQTSIERVEYYATFKDKGLWMGYAEFAADLQSYRRMLGERDFAKWLVRKTMAGEDVAERVGGYEPDEVVNIIVFNLFHSNKLSFEMSYRKVKEICEAAQKNKEWLKRAKARYESFKASLPPRFKSILTMTDRYDRSLEHFLFNNARKIAGKRTSLAANIDFLCLMTGVPAPGLTKEARELNDWN